jgi:hypothetical protein
MESKIRKKSEVQELVEEVLNEGKKELKLSPNRETGYSSPNRESESKMENDIPRINIESETKMNNGVLTKSRGRPKIKEVKGELEKWNEEVLKKKGKKNNEGDYQIEEDVEDEEINEEPLKKTRKRRKKKKLE